MGLPLITTRVGGIPEVCGDYAIFIEKKDIVDNLSKVLSNMYTDRVQHKPLSCQKIMICDKYDKVRYSMEFFNKLI